MHIRVKCILWIFPVIALSGIILPGCGGGGGGEDPPMVAPSSSVVIDVECTDPCSVLLSWDANREKAVNSAGGGYKIYYSTDSDFQITDSGVTIIDIPCTPPDPLPTFKSIAFPSKGTWYVRVAAYSSLNGGSTSAPTAVKIVKVN